jgi:hypothetical protein
MRREGRGKEEERAQKRNEKMNRERAKREEKDRIKPSTFTFELK